MFKSKYKNTYHIANTTSYSLIANIATTRLILASTTSLTSDTFTSSTITYTIGLSGIVRTIQRAFVNGIC